MNTKFEFADKFGFEEQFDFQEEHPGEFINNLIDVKEVFKLLGAIFNEEWTGEGEEDEEFGYVGPTVELVLSKVNVSNLISSKSNTSILYKDRKYFYKCYVNSKIDFIDYGRLFVYKKWGGYRLYFTYESDKNISFNEDKLEKYAAIKFQSLGIENLLLLLDVCKRNFSKNAIEGAYKDLTNSLKYLAEPKTHLTFLRTIPQRVLQRFTISDLEKILYKILNEYWLFAAREKSVLYVLEATVNHEKFNPDKFLKNLLVHKVDGQSVFMKLYDDMNNVGLTDNFTAIIKLLYKVWAASDFTKTDNKSFSNKKYSVSKSIAYTSEYTLGFNSDSHDFYFDKDQNVVVKGKLTDEESAEVNKGRSYRYGNIQKYSNEIQVFHPFQPIRLTETSKNNDLEGLDINKGVDVPAFYLKAFDDLGDWGNIATTISLIIDVASFTVGVWHFKALLKITKAFKVIHLAFGGLEILSSSLSVTLSLLKGKLPKEDHKRLSNFLFWFDICTLGADALTMRVLKKQAENTKDGITRFQKKVQNTNVEKKIDEAVEVLNSCIYKFARVDVDIMKQEMPTELLEALTKMGKTKDGEKTFSELEVLNDFVGYHRGTDYRFLNDLDKFVKKYPHLTKTDIFVMWGYTTKYFYWYLNLRLRNKYFLDKVEALARLLTKAISKMPRYSGDAYRALTIENPKLLGDFLDLHKQGEIVKYNDFVSCGSSKKAAFFDKKEKNILLEMKVKDAPIISDFADGIMFRGYQREELLLLRGRNFIVEKVKIRKDGKYLIKLVEV